MRRKHIQIKTVTPLNPLAKPTLERRDWIARDGDYRRTPGAAGIRALCTT
jgi:hypothetical protein